MATRLRDYYEHELQHAAEYLNRPYSQLESYGEWLDRLGLSEEDDDNGDYGDDEPTWYGETVGPAPEIDLKKIRRRIKDHLRKTADEAVILEIAKMLNIKTD